MSTNSFNFFLMQKCSYIFEDSNSQHEEQPRCHCQLYSRTRKEVIHDSFYRIAFLRFVLRFAADASVDKWKSSFQPINKQKEESEDKSPSSEMR